jgi:AcrR family transcriptional regulator
MQDSPGRPSLRDEQKALTRRRLIDGAEAVFARSGFHGASVEEVAREAGVTTGALYSNFAGKEDLFLALFEERIAADVSDYSQIVAEGATLEEQARGAGDRWMAILEERPAYFPLLIEFWAYAIREPLLRERLAERFAALRAASARLALEGAERQGYSPDAEASGLVGLLINALGNGLALEKLADPDAVPDSLYGDLLVLIFQALQALAREGPSTDGPAAETAGTSPADAGVGAAGTMSAAGTSREPARGKGEAGRAGGAKGARGAENA